MRSEVSMEKYSWMFLYFFTVISAMIQGAEDDDKFVVKHYKPEEYPSILKEYFASRVPKAQ